MGNNIVVYLHFLSRIGDINNGPLDWIVLNDKSPSAVSPSFNTRLVSDGSLNKLSFLMTKRFADDFKLKFISDVFLSTVSSNKFICEQNKIVISQSAVILHMYIPF